MPLCVVRILVLLLGLVGGLWPHARRYRSVARFLLVVSQYDAIGECCGSRRMADYMQELADGSGRDRRAQMDSNSILEGHSKKMQ